MKIIAFTGKYQSGKTTCANFIQNTIKLSFAKPVKDIAKRQFGWDGQKDDRGRKLLQLIGTDVGREYNPNIWVEKMEQEFENKEYWHTNIIIIDDLRFNNEAELIKKWEGIIIEIIRPGYNGDNHKSEQGIDKIFINYTIENDGTIEELKNKVFTIIEKEQIK